MGAHSGGRRVPVPRALRHVGGGHRAPASPMDWQAIVALGALAGYVVAAVVAVVLGFDNPL